MKSVVEFRAQAKLCRHLAMCEPNNRIYWLVEADRWSHLAQDEISSHYQACNIIQAVGGAAPVVPSSAA